MLILTMLAMIVSHALAFYLGHRLTVVWLAKACITLADHRREIARIIGDLIADPKIRIER